MKRSSKRAARSERARRFRGSASRQRDELLAFRIEFSQVAAGKYRKLERGLKDRIARKLESVSEDPKRFLSRLSSVEAHKLRVGDYRIIIDVEWERKVLIVLTLGHRSTVYR
ncbi:MAG TPA: type II toxin-antitoxin system RelE/ParE family toxin [Thermoplasmata archaeon]